MTQLSDILNITISRQTAVVQTASFSIPCFIAAHTQWSDRARVYPNLTAIQTDFGSTGNVYQAAVEFFEQNIAPTQIVIGRRQVDTVDLSVGTVSNNATYTLTINGTIVTFTSSGAATAINIVAGLKTAFTAAAISGITFTDNLDGTAIIGVSATGTAWSILSSVNLKLTNVTPTEVWADAITAVRASNDTWYGLTADSHLPADVEAIAAYIEASGSKIFGTSTQDPTVQSTGTTDIAATLQNLDYVRTWVFWNSQADSIYPECAWMGYMLSKVPGSADWTYKQLVGVPVDTITETASVNLAAKNVTTFQTIGGYNVTVGGNVAGGEKIDVMVGVDWTKSDMSTNIWSRLVNLDKIPYTNAGGAIIETEIRRTLSQGITNSLYASSPAPTVTIPNTTTISPNTRAARNLPGITFTAQLAGAIRFVGIAGTVYA